MSRYYHDHTHTTHEGHDFRPAATPQKFAALVGTIDPNTDKAIQGRSGDHLQFYVQVGASTRYQVDVNTQSRDGSAIEVYIASEALKSDSTNPNDPFGQPAYGVFPNAALSYAGLGLTDNDFAPINASRIEAHLEAALGAATFVSIYGQVFDDGGDDGKGIHETHFTGHNNQDGAVAVYTSDPNTGAPSRTWFFFKFKEDDLRTESGGAAGATVPTVAAAQQ
jgi:hypothetical protein